MGRWELNGVSLDRAKWNKMTGMIEIVGRVGTRDGYDAVRIRCGGGWGGGWTGGQ